MENRKQYPRFAELFSNIQTSLGITTDQMRDHLDVDLSTVKRYQDGTRAPNEATILLIAAAFTAHWANRPLPAERDASDKARRDRRTEMGRTFWTFHRKLVMAKTHDVASAKGAVSA